MELRQLRYAVAVADHGSLTAAARACYVAQPSLSEALASLERELGVALFVRGPRRVTPTAAGEAFVPAARVALRDVDVVREEVEAVRGVVAGRLTVGVLPSLAGPPVTEWIGEFRARHPGVTARVGQAEDSMTLVDDVVAGALDLAVVDAASVAGRPGVVRHPVGRQELVVIGPPGRPLPRSPLAPADLAALALVATPPGTSLRVALDGVLAAAGVPATPAVETTLRDLLVPLVLAGAGVALVPERQGREARRGGAALRRLRPGVGRELVLVTRDGRPSPALERFLAVVDDARPHHW